MNTKIKNLLTSAVSAATIAAGTFSVQAMNRSIPNEIFSVEPKDYLNKQSTENFDYLKNLKGCINDLLENKSEEKCGDQIAKLGKKYYLYYEILSSKNENDEKLNDSMKDLLQYLVWIISTDTKKFNFYKNLVLQLRNKEQNSKPNNVLDNKEYQYAFGIKFLRALLNLTKQNLNNLFE